ncbi:glycoside hydrolase family 127 protein [Microbacterium stercoris]|uniref:Glycoside hydrolase family 127 protein n=1 Tax=Microbacterium stercoris TaxID=2820289 RepID=A0A939QKN3_9MICO|nr:beta-L-arabinofuranosidase domain-containing protein [Microbacterium stercoris]MBO3664639.1 glycoside hydrolase family 127 protein [Microbacterium stercoris]
MTRAAIPAPVLPSAGVLTPLGLDESRITGGLWAQKQVVNAAATLEHIRARLESEGWLPNFDLAAAGALPEGRRGREFADSEVYKWLEALAWEIGRGGSDELEQTFRAAVARVAAAQEADGYLNTMFGREGQRPRWSDLEWGHELYCAGHLLQAAVARARTRPGSDDGLLEVAIRVADLVVREFGPGAREAICGHAEIELGLAELGRVTGDRRYTEQAALFVERHGKHTLRDIEHGRAYYQDDVAVREAEALRGHAVRANYLAASAVDVAIDTGDADLLAALERQWSRTIARRTYITGGQGARHSDEAFGEDWELPSDRAYSETCAGIASLMFAWRLLLATGEARYADLIERILYNVLATSVSDEGTAFFYSNPLQQRVEGAMPDPGETVGRASTSLRAPWFSVSCCPTNIGRTIASLGAYLATTTAHGVQVHQYAAGEIRTASGIALTVDTAYPARGRIVVRIDEPGDFEIALRVPGWAHGATLDGAPVSPGYARVRRRWNEGDEVVLELPVAPRVSLPDPRIDAVRGSVAIERGPEVWALESVDLGTDVAGAVLVPGSVRAEGEGVVADFLVREDDAAAWPYAAEQPPAGEQRTSALVPYRRWGNRGPATMRVFLPLAT